MTDWAEYTCVFKESDEGVRWLEFECSSGNANVPGPLKGKKLKMELHPSTTREQAKELAAQIRQRMVGIWVT